MKKIIGLEKYERVDIYQYDSWTNIKRLIQENKHKVANDWL